MKTIITSIAASLFTVSVSVSVNATDIYNGLDAGNSDLSTPHVSATDFVGVQPGVGDSINRYNGLDDGNADLFKADNSGRTDSGDAPDIYPGIGSNSSVIEVIVGTTWDYRNSGSASSIANCDRVWLRDVQLASV